jgi:hypothetical protein
LLLVETIDLSNQIVLSLISKRLFEKVSIPRKKRQGVIK